MSKTFAKNWDIYNRMNKGYRIPQEYIDEEPSRWRREHYRKHNQSERVIKNEASIRKRKRD